MNWIQESINRQTNEGKSAKSICYSIYRGYSNRNFGDRYTTDQVTAALREHTTATDEETELALKIVRLENYIEDTEWVPEYWSQEEENDAHHWNVGHDIPQLKQELEGLFKEFFGSETTD
jgi:hypothetical protein